MEEVVEKIAEAKAVATTDEAESVIRAQIKDCVDGISDREVEALALASEWGIEEQRVKERFADARKAREAEAATKALTDKLIYGDPKPKPAAEPKWKPRRGKWAEPEADGFAEALGDAIAKPKADPFFFGCATT